MGEFCGEIEETPFNVCGQIGERYIIESPIDDIVKRDFSVYSCFDSTHPETNVFLMFPRHDVHQNRKNTSVHRMLRVLNLAKNRSVHFPKLAMAGKLQQLIFGCDGEQAFERDPEWPDRPAIIIETDPCLLSYLPYLSPNGAIPVDTVLLIGIGIFRALAALHRLGFVHRLVSPHSFTMPSPMSVDSFQRGISFFDLSHVIPFPAKPRPYVPFIGTMRYSSVRVHYGREQGPSDDVISLIYLLAEFISVKLPWRSVRDENTVVAMKQDFYNADAFRKLPKELRTIYREMHTTPGPAMIDHQKILGQLQAAVERRNSPLRSKLPPFLSIEANQDVLAKRTLRRVQLAAKK